MWLCCSRGIMTCSCSEPSSITTAPPRRMMVGSMLFGSMVSTYLAWQGT